ncbi:MAG: hypothetical protein NC230_04415 [Bacteroides sp.]|nr:hypothetical protein [Bacteroides sp.]
MRFKRFYAFLSLLLIAMLSAGSLLQFHHHDCNGDACVWLSGIDLNLSSGFEKESCNHLCDEAACDHQHDAAHGHSHDCASSSCSLQLTLGDSSGDTAVKHLAVQPVLLPLPPLYVDISAEQFLGVIALPPTLLILSPDSRHPVSLRGSPMV